MKLNDCMKGALKYWTNEDQEHYERIHYQHLGVMLQHRPLFNARSLCDIGAEWSMHALGALWARFHYALMESGLPTQFPKITYEEAT